MKLKFFKTTFFLVVQLFICLLIIEGVCYIFLLTSANPLYRARRILNYDPTVAWFQKPGLKTNFYNSVVNTDSNGFRINPLNQNTAKQKVVLTLGPSSAFGWGVDFTETYSSLVADKLGSSLVNASGIGHSMLQGEILWKKYFKETEKNIDVALIAYGVNDLDKYRFFDSEPESDKVFFTKVPLGLTLDKINSDSSFLMTLSLVLRELDYKNNCSQLSSSSQRVPWNDFKSSLSKIIADMKSKKIKPVIIGTAFYLKHANPGFTQEKIDDAYNEVHMLARSGKCSKAYEKLKLAKALEPDHIHSSVIELNKNLKSYADSNGIIFIDTNSILNAGLIDENYVDPVHPSESGHRKIAHQIIEALSNNDLKNGQSE